MRASKKYSYHLQGRSERPQELIKIKKTFSFRLIRIVTDLYNFFYQEGLKYDALNPEESLQLLLKSRKSLIRFGNGESEILVGLDMPTQIYNKELAKGLANIIKDYNADCNYLLALTNWNLTKSVRELKDSRKKRKYYMWRYMRYLFFKFRIGEKGLPFLETDMFRDLIRGVDRSKIETLWSNINYIIIVHNNEKYFRWFNEEYKGKKLYFVKIPDKNFFSVLPETQKKIMDLINENNIDRNDLIVMVSAGPGANILCYNLCQKDENILCYDMGNFFHNHFQSSQ